MPREMFDRVYATTDRKELRALYDEWAADYDADLTEQHYETPGRVAEALARHAGDDVTVVDFACGTGLSGLALAAAGFTAIDGYDVSPGMLEIAGTTGAYRELILGDPDDPLPFRVGDYAAVVACGAISPGAAPARTLDDVIGALAPGGLFVVSLNEHALDDPDFVGRIDAAVERGSVELVEAQNGPHLPDLGLTSTVYVLRGR